MSPKLITFDWSTMGQVVDSINLSGFWFPTVKSALRYFDLNDFSVDMEFGDMFLNFPLHN